jgi:hypothetical protein
MGDRNLAHALYLPPLSRANADAADVTARVMSHLKRIAPDLSRRGVVVDVYRIRQKDVSNPRVQAALRGKEVDALPAVLAAGRTLVGLREIEVFYDNFLNSRQRSGSRSGTAAMRAQDAVDMYDDDQEDVSAAHALDEFYREAMGVGSRDEGESSYKTQFNMAASDMGLDFSQLNRV